MTSPTTLVSPQVRLHVLGTWTTWTVWTFALFVAEAGLGRSLGQPVAISAAVGAGAALGFAPAAAFTLASIRRGRAGLGRALAGYAANAFLLADIVLWALPGDRTVGYSLVILAIVPTAITGVGFWLRVRTGPAPPAGSPP